MFQMTLQELRAFELQLADKVLRGSGLAHDTQARLRACLNDAERIEYLRSLVEQAQQAIFWAKEFVAKWERACLKREKEKKRERENQMESNQLEDGKVSNDNI